VAYLMTVSTTSQAASAADANSARAYQAARAGAEWGAYFALRGGAFRTACETGPGFTATQNLTFGSTLASFTATVTCTFTTYDEGASTAATATSVKAYRIVSTGCNLPTGGGACPNAAATTTTYVERELALTVTN
jgi:MSHA biogenesis protein MshP